MSYLAELQDPEMAQLKASSSGSSVPSPDVAFADGAMRGRADYSNLDALRTKPGRADAPSSTSMSCSDKIASWNVTGLQGALLSDRVEPVFLRQVIISLPPQIEATQELHLRACQRALSGRTQSISGCKAASVLHLGGPKRNLADQAGRSAGIAPKLEVSWTRHQFAFSPDCCSAALNAQPCAEVISASECM